MWIAFEFGTESPCSTVTSSGSGSPQTREENEIPMSQQARNRLATDYWATIEVDPSLAKSALGGAGFDGTSLPALLS